MDQESKRAFQDACRRGAKKEKSFEEKKRLKDEARRRKASQQKPKPRRRPRGVEDEDDFDPFERIRAPQALQRGSAPRTEPSLARRAGTGDTGSGDPDGGALEQALVVSVARSRAVLETRDGLVHAALPPALAASEEIAVGDRVLHERRDGGLALVRSVLPRTSSLSRPDPARPERRRVLAANVDVVLAVVSVRTPPFKPGLLDRVLLATEEGGARPAIAVNKADLIASDAERAELEADLAPFRALGVPAVLVSAASGLGLAELRAILAGATCVFVGPSGVGKSSLLNALDPARVRATGHVRASDGKGRHTTSASELVDLGGGTLLVDTPGVRQFGLWSFDRRTLASYFPELAAAAPRCRFRDCSHLSEPGCAVAGEVEAGRIARRRFDAYRRIHASLGP